ncbi:MAG: CehA/McbA family metallohydrolase, partial [Caldilineaceae bacterium]
NPSFPPKSAFRSSGQWLRGDLQCHTFHSDAKGSPRQLLDKAKALGLDFLAVTDHNNTSHHRALAALDDGSLLLIPGQEVTTYYGHMNVWGTGQWCDFRCRTPDDIRAIIQLAHKHGGFCSINHPKQGGPAWEYGFDLPVDALEVWQGPWPYRNTESLALWDRLLAQGWRIPVVGGSDYHCPAREETNFLRLGQPTTWVRVTEHSVAGVLAGIRKGWVSISASPDGPRLEMRAESSVGEAEMGEALAVGGAEPVAVTARVWRGKGLVLRLVVDGDTAFEQRVLDDETTVHASIEPGRSVRAELIGDCPPALLPPQAPADLDLRGWRWALTNPIYCAREESGK